MSSNADSSVMRRAVIVMAKRPAPGRTKTRLTPELSMEQAADLYERLLIDTVRAIDARTDCSLVIAVDAPESVEYFTQLAPDALLVHQRGEALGDRLNVVLGECLAQGFDQAFALGSDSPDLPSSHLDAAFALLDDVSVDAVLGPTDDGGYYLIGWKQTWPQMVTEVQMSTPNVLRDTLARAADLGASVALAPQWYDVDDASDLERLRTSVAQAQIAATADFLATL